MRADAGMPASSTSLAAQQHAAAELVDLLQFYREDRMGRRTTQGETSLRVVSFDGILEKALEPVWRRRLVQVREDPVRTVLKDRAREIGWRLYATGGLALMGAVLDLVDEATPGRPGGAVLDKWWDGLGVYDNGGVWCA